MCSTINTIYFIKVILRKLFLIRFSKIRENNTEPFPKYFEILFYYTRISLIFLIKIIKLIELTEFFLHVLFTYNIFIINILFINLNNYLY